MEHLSLLSREPVRVYLYGVVGAIVALLVGVGVVSSGVAPLILAVVTAVLAVPAVEAARAKVTPVDTLELTDTTASFGNARSTSVTEDNFTSRAYRDENPL